MKVNLTIEVDDEDRRAIAHHQGGDSKASYEDVKTWVRSILDTTLEEVGYALTQELEDMGYEVDLEQG